MTSAQRSRSSALRFAMRLHSQTLDAQLAQQSTMCAAHVDINVLPNIQPTFSCQPSLRTSSCDQTTASRGSSPTRSSVGPATTAARLDKLEELIWQQQSEIVQLRNEAKVLRDCLVETGALRADKFAVKFHQHQFESILGTHPLKSDTDLVMALETPEVALLVGIVAGPYGIEALRATSRAACQAVSCVEKYLPSLFSKSIIVVGGFDGQELSRSAERFDPNVGAWESLPSMNVPRSVFGARVVDDSLYVCGGNDGPLSAERFAHGAESWAPMAQMASRRTCTGMAVLGERLHVCTGYDWERYDLVLNRWQKLPSMSVSREGAAVATLCGRLYVCGGMRGGVYVNAVESYDPMVEEWNMVARMLAHRADAAAAIVGGKLYVCGGRDGNRLHTSSERYDPHQGLWEAMPPMSEGRTSPAVAVTGGRIYLCGGRDGRKCLSSVERFDPAALIWETLCSLSVKRSQAATVVLGGKLYVCGGRDGAAISRAVERFDPDRGEWELLPSMSGCRSDASACAIWGCTGLGAQL